MWSGVPTSAFAAQDCAALANLKINNTNLLSAAEVLADGDLPAYCRVLGYVRPAINFEIKLPLQAWNGKFYMVGCGGFCGTLNSEARGFSNAMNFGLRRNYAVSASDSGHWGTNAVDARWALHNPVAVMDWAQRYVPEMTVKVVYRRDRYLRGGDHIPFLAQGYAAVRFTEAHEDFRHQHQDVRAVDGVQYGDLPEFVDFEYLASVARINAAALASLARAPSPPSGVRIETLRLENQTTLSWLANPEADLAGYEVVWRETTAPFWQGAEFVGNVTRASVPLSKDDYLFSVRAVGNGGRRSLATYPLTLRNPLLPAAK